MKQIITLIAAVARDSEGRNVIGNIGKIPWWDDEELRKTDMNHFRKITLGKTVIMGYTTFLSLGKTLSQRTNIILSRKKGLVIPEALVFDSLDSALSKAYELDSEAYIIGGQQLYEQTIRLSDKLEMTEIDAEYKGDTFFPNYRDAGEWNEHSWESHKGFRFVTYERMHRNVVREFEFLLKRNP